MKIVLISGGAGYMGGILAEMLLVAKCEVTTMDNLEQIFL